MHDPVMFGHRAPRTTWFIAAVAAALTDTTSALGWEPPVCGPRPDILSALGTRFKEAPSAVGLANSGVLLELLTNDDGSTWMIIVSRADGLTCVVAAGEDWQPVEREPTGPQL